MVVPEQSRLYTMEEFKEFVSRPENSDRLFELINGEIIEVTPGRTRNSGFGILLAVAVHQFCRTHNIPCYISGGDGAYDVNGHTVAPDFAYKRTPLSDDYPDPNPPLWVLEVVSPTDKAPDIRDKREIYEQAGILLWEMYPKRQSIDVYAPGQKKRTFGINDTLDGGDVLPRFTLPMRELFR
jgi:Uma2 family endonuclease